jgi:hypothetical protein
LWLKLSKLLLSHGATEVSQTPSPSHPDISFDLSETTHIIAADIHFPGFPEAEQAMVPVVTPAWVEASVKKKRLAHVRPFTPDERLFFSGIIVTTAELPAGDREAIFGGVVALGGQYNVNLTKFVTHIVCLDLDNVGGILYVDLVLMMMGVAKVPAGHREEVGCQVCAAALVRIQF